MSDNFFLKKITSKLNNSNHELEKRHLNATIAQMNNQDRNLYSEVKEKVNTSVERDPYLVGVDRLVLSDQKKHNVPRVIARNKRKNQSQASLQSGESDTDRLFRKIITKSAV